MAEHDRKDSRTPQQVFRDESEAAAKNLELVKEALATAGDRCPDCGRLGSIEEVEGVLKCIDCNLEILQAAQLGGLGRNLPLQGGAGRVEVANAPEPRLTSRRRRICRCRRGGCTRLGRTPRRRARRCSSA